MLLLKILNYRIKKNQIHRWNNPYNKIQNIKVELLEFLKYLKDKKGRYQNKIYLLIKIVWHYKHKI